MIQFTRNLRFTWYYHFFKDYIQSKCCSIPLLQDTRWGMRLLHFFKKSRCTFHVNGNRKSLEEYCFNYQVSIHLPYLSKTTINLRENLVQVGIYTVSLYELFENYTGRRTHFYSGRMTRLKYPSCIVVSSWSLRIFHTFFLL